MEQLANAPGELPLGATNEALLGERAEDGVRDRRRLPDRLELTRLLDRPQPLHEAGLRHGLHPALLERLVRGDGEDVRLDADRAAGEARREVADDRAGGPLEADVERARPLRVAEVRVERRVSVRLHEDGRVRAREPGEVADVDQARDEERLVEERGEPLDPAHRLSARNSSASR
jgi:hypothetical protein